MGRYKHLIVPKLRARTNAGHQQGEAALAVQVLNRMIREAKPATTKPAGGRDAALYILLDAFHDHQNSCPNPSRFRKSSDAEPLPPPEVLRMSCWNSR